MKTQLDNISGAGMLIDHDPQQGQPKQYNYELPFEPIDYERQLLVKKFCDDRRIYDEDIQEAAWHRGNGTIAQFHATNDLRKRRVQPWQKKFLVRLRHCFAVNEKLDFIHSPEMFRGRLRRATWRAYREFMAEDASDYTIKTMRRVWEKSGLITRRHPMQKVKIKVKADGKTVNKEVDWKMAFDDFNPEAALKLLDEAEADAKRNKLYQRRKAAEKGRAKKNTRSRAIPLSILAQNAGSINVSDSGKSEVFPHKEAGEQLPNKEVCSTISNILLVDSSITTGNKENDYVTGSDAEENNSMPIRLTDLF